MDNLKSTNSHIDLSSDDEQADYTCGLTDTDLDKRFRGAVEIALKENEIRGIKTAFYDKEKKKMYQLNEDGTKSYL